MPPKNKVGLTEKQRIIEIPKKFLRYKKIPNSTIVFCDDKRISNIRTQTFVYNNIFGGDEIEDELIIKKHILILLGDAEGNELVDEKGNSFLYNEFCI